jgi:hypothetical protein
MIKKTLPIAGLVVGLAVIATASILTQPTMDGDAAPVISQIDANALTLKARNLPVQVIDDAI